MVALRSYSWWWCLSWVGIIVCSASLHAQAVRDSGIIYVRPPNAVATIQFGDVEPLPSDDATWQRAIATQAALIGRPPTLMQVLNNPNSAVVNTQWFAKFKSPSEASDWLSQNFRVAQIPGTALVEVWIDSQQIDPKEAALVVNEVLSQYIENAKRNASDALLNRKNALQQLQSRHETQARQAKQDTSRARGELQMDSNGKSGAIARKEAELLQLITAKVKVEREVEESARAYETALAQVQKGGLPAPVNQMVDQLPNVNFWRQFVDQIEVQLRPMPQGDLTPEAKALTEKRDAAQKKLDAIRKEQVENLTVSYLEQLNGRVVGTKRELEGINKSIEKLRLDISDLSFQLANFHQRNEEQEAFEELARRERNQLDRLNAVISAMDTNQIMWMVQAGARFKQ